jgi:hypothetical protein
VAVGVKGHVYGGVPEKLLYQFRVNAPAQKQGGAGMPEVMETYLWQSSSIEKWFEGPFDKILGVDGRAPLRGEDQAAFFVKPCEPYLLFKLALAVDPQGVYRPGVRLTWRRP